MPIKPQCKTRGIEIARMNGGLGSFVMEGTTGKPVYTADPLWFDDFVDIVHRSNKHTL